VTGLAAGTRVGAYRIIELIGRGGMQQMKDVPEKEFP